jgi:hypothetical protein
MSYLRAASVVAWVLPACAGGSGPGNTTLGDGSISDGGSDDPVTGAQSTSSTPSTSSEAEASSDAVDSTGAEPPDLSTGTWMFENVSVTPIMGFHPRRALTVDGREIVAWAETAPDDISTLNIMAATKDGDAWSTVALTQYAGVQNTYPFLVAAPFPILAWSGRTAVDDDDDVFVSAPDAQGWGAVRNISDVLEPATEARADLRPALAARDDGGLAIAYLSGTIGATGPDATPEVFVSEFLLEENPTKRLPLVDTTTTNCTDIAGAASRSGVFHFVMSCNQTGSSTLLQATNRSGEWKTDELSGLGTSILSPSMARGVEGVHLVWIQSQPCGTESCAEVFHTVTDDEVFGTPVAVTDQVNLDERRPAVGVDPWGRVLVLHQAAVDGAVGIYLSVSDDGTSFSSIGRISPDGTADDYQTPTTIGFDADGLPSFALEVLTSGSDPLNVDVYVARFVPG